MKRLSLLLLVLLVSVSVFAETPEYKTITVVLKATTNVDGYEKIFAKFEEETGHTVEIQLIPAGEEYGTLLQTRFATKDYPDVFEMDPGTKQYIKFRASETLYEWTGDSLFDNVMESTVEGQMLDGKIYGVPWSTTNYLGVFYNKQIFKDLGLSIPQNYSEFIDACEALKTAGYIPIYDAIATGWPSQIFSLDGWTSEVDQAIGVEGVLKIEANQLRLNEIPAFKAILEKQYALLADGYLQDDALAGTYELQQDLFHSGKVGMIIQGAWALKALADKFGKDFVDNSIGYFPLPAENGPGTATLYQAPQFLVPKLTENVNEAVELVRFMTSKENLDIYYSTKPGLPVYKGIEPEMYTADEEVLSYILSGNATLNIQNRLSSSFTDYPKILQNMFITGDIDAALDLLDENFRRTGKARGLPGF